MQQNIIHLKSGQQLTFPVPVEHPLARFQSIRLPTREEIEKHPFYSRIIALKIGELQTRQGSPLHIDEFKRTLVSSIIGRIGSIWSYGFNRPPFNIDTPIIFLPNITVEQGATLTFSGNYSEVFANDVTVYPGGTIKVSSGDPTISATLALNCQLLSTGS